MAGSLLDALKQAGLTSDDDGPGSAGNGDRRRDDVRGGNGSSRLSQVPDERRFHNPYHFVPVKRRDNLHWVERHGLERLADIAPEDPLARLSHARYLNQPAEQTQPAEQDSRAGCYSGRILCRLEAEGPFFIGARRSKEATETSPAEVEPFELEPTIPAIPASSLRGLISSLAEAASGSALRVLHNAMLSYRREMGDSLSALGMIVGEGPEFCLLPLTLPTLEGDQKKGYHHRDARRWDAFRAMFPEPRLKVLIGNYGSAGQEGAFLDALVTYRPDAASPADEAYYYMRLDKSVWIWNSDGLNFDLALRTKPRKTTADAFVIGQKATGLPDRAPGPEKTRGIVRILGKKNRGDMPSNKRHEVFIPCPEGVEQGPTFRILPEAIRRFHELASERTEETWRRVLKDPAAESKVHPFHPQGSRDEGERRAADGHLALREGDIVYFNARMEGGEPVVDEVSFSAIWRGRVDDASGERADVHKFFAAIDPELLPFNKDRQWISPAEQVFGFVQHDRSDDGGGLAYSGRVRFGFGRLAIGQPTPHYMPEVTLKVLDTPKPPSPPMYFKSSGGTEHIHKKDLRPGRHHPQGRKHYVHHSEALEGLAPWETSDPFENTKQKVRIAPIKCGTAFYFHCDFDNLNAWELGLICYALRPNDTFRHKLGMGKPIGLGQVRIDPVGLFLIDRHARYAMENPFLSPRYHHVSLDAGVVFDEWPNCYETEREAAKPLAEALPNETSSVGRGWEAFRDGFAASLDPDIANALCLLGNPGIVKHPVHTPQVWEVFGPENVSRGKVTGAEMESEAFRWYVANDRGSGSAKKQNQHKAAERGLEPLTKDSLELPWLERYDWGETD